MGTELNLNEITSLKRNGVIAWAWGEMSSNFVDRETGWESNSSFELLALLSGESLGKFLSNEIVNSSTNSGNIGAINGEGNGFLEGG